MPRPAVFLDRDGVVVDLVDHLHRIDQLRLLDGAAEAIRRLNALAIPAVIVTNQSAVARGLLSEAELGRLHDALREMLETRGARLDALYYCPHHPELGAPPYRRACDCRKPAPGLVLRAARELGIDLARSAVVGDSLHDLEAGRRAGCGRTVLVLTGHGAGEAARLAGDMPRPDEICADLAAAVTALYPEHGAAPDRTTGPR